jgi:cysteine desulfurase
MEAYLDYNATSPIDPEVAEAMAPFLRESFGNPSSFHRKGQSARHAVEESREILAETLGVEPGDLVFTSGGTEADNLAVKGVMDFMRDERNHLVVSTIEHQAVLHPAQHLSKMGYEVDFAPVTEAGTVDLDYLKEVICHRTALVSVMHVNNETGVIQPIEAAARLAHEKGALFHTDAVQSYGKMPIDAEEMGFDLLSLSAHKICGPKGAGALFVKKGIKLKSVTHGGHQEKNIRPGTENVAAIVGLGKAARLAAAGHEAEARRVGKLRDFLLKGLRERISGVHLNGRVDHRIYNTLNVSFEGIDGETLLMNLDLKNIFVSTGSACTAGSVEPSHVLLAMDLPADLARAAIRFSMGRFTTEREIEYALEELPPIIDRLRSSSTRIKR